jgi:hypothetical protein
VRPEDFQLYFSSGGKANRFRKGFAEERAQLMNTDHRHICKFESVSDPNYVDLRNALAATVDDIVQECQCMPH